MASHEDVLNPDPAAQRREWAATALKTDWSIAPISVLPESAPRLSWVALSSRNDAHQARYRVSVSQDDRLVWDTRFVDGSQVAVTYAGPALQPRTRYDWSVEIVDEQGNHAQADMWFETTVDRQTLAEAANHWISADEDHEPAPVLRREFTVDTAPLKARLYVAGLGLHRCTLNGERVSDDELESGFTDYDHTVLFSTYDVTDLVQQGNGVLGVELGRGFFSLTTENTWRWHSAPWHAERKVWARLEITDAAGAIQVVATDPSWTWHDGPTRFDSLYEGETFDARLDPQGWDRPGFDASDWRATVASTPPRGRLVPRTHEPVRVTHSTPPAQWHRVGPTTFVADAGRTTAGWASVDNRAVPAGHTVTLTYGEQRDDEGGVVAKNRHVLSSDRFQRDELTMGSDSTSWHSRFTYKGFRYIQVDGVSSPDDIVLTICDVHTDVATASSFSCSDPVLTWIDSAMRASILNNLHHVPTDTPMMEKNGWTGDAQVGVESMLGEFDLRRLLGKWLDDMADSQELASTGPRSPDGEVQEGRLPVVIPSPGWGYIELAPSPEWTTVYPFVLDRLVQWHADPTLAARHLQPVLRYLEHELARLDDDDLSLGDLGDWLAPGPTSRPVDDKRIAASCYLYRALVITADLLATVHGEALDLPQGWEQRAESMLRGAERIKDAVNRTFLDTEQGLYRSEREPEYRQASNILPVALGITPTDQIHPVIENLVADIHANDDHHNAGCLGVSQLLRILTAHGHADLAITVATQTTPPSWGAWRQAGENTMLEMWRDSSRSHDHYFMGTPAQWLYESVAGVTPLEPGWATFAVNPIVDDRLDHAAYTLESNFGELGVSWRRDGSALELVVTVPVGARSRVQLPDRPDPVWVGSGRWSFTAQL